MKLPTKFVIVVRHGAYDRDEKGLYPFGQRQMQYMAEQVANYCAGARVVLRHSSALRCKQGAEIIGAHLKIQPEERRALDPQSSPTYSDLLDCLDADCDVLILVTHFEWMSALPEEAMRSLDVGGFRRPRDRSPREGVGAAVLVDCVAKTCTDIPELSS